MIKMMTNERIVKIQIKNALSRSMMRVARDGLREWLQHSAPCVVRDAKRRSVGTGLKPAYNAIGCVITHHNAAVSWQAAWRLSRIIEVCICSVSAKGQPGLPFERRLPQMLPFGASPSLERHGYCHRFQRMDLLSHSFLARRRAF